TASSLIRIADEDEGSPVVGVRIGPVVLHRWRWLRQRRQQLPLGPSLAALDALADLCGHLQCLLPRQAAQPLLGLAQRRRLGHGCFEAVGFAEEIGIEALNEKCGGGVVHLPQTQANAATAAQQERLREADEALATLVLAQCRFASREGDQFTVEVPA